MDKILDILAAYPTWVKFLVVILSAVILLLLISFRQNPNPAQSSQQELELPLSVEIEGPATAPLGKTTYYTVLVKNAVRGIWSIGGIQNEPVVVQPLGPSHQIYVEPTDATRVGNSFTIVFVAYDTQGRSAIAKKRFLVVSN
jgi:hypothetical protein